VTNPEGKKAVPASLSLKGLEGKEGKRPAFPGQEMIFR